MKHAGLLTLLAFAVASLVGNAFGQDPVLEPIVIDPIEEVVIEDVQLDIEIPHSTPKPQPVDVPKSEPPKVVQEHPQPEPEPPQPVTAPEPEPIAAVPVQPEVNPSLSEAESSLPSVPSEPVVLNDSSDNLDDEWDDDELLGNRPGNMGEAKFREVVSQEEDDSIYGVAAFMLLVSWAFAAIFARAKVAVVFYDVKDYGLSAAMWGSLILGPIAMEFAGDNIGTIVMLGCLGFALVTFFRIFGTSIRYNRSIPMGLLTGLMKVSLMFLTIPFYLGVLLFEKLQGKKKGCAIFPLSVFALIFGGLGTIFMNGKAFYTKKGWVDPLEKDLL